MRLCEFCGKEISGQADFCGYCGRTASYVPGALTSNSWAPSIKQNDLNKAAAFSTSNWVWEEGPPANANQQYSHQPTPDDGTDPMPDEEEEDKRRRAAWLNMGLVGLAEEMQPPADYAPMVHGTPQPGGVPSVQGTPQMGSNFSPQLPPEGIYTAQTLQTIPAAGPQYAPPYVPNQPPTIHHPLHPHHPHSPHHTTPGGCAPTWLILLFAAIIIISSMLGIGLTVLSPSLTLTGSGSTDIALGDSLHLHGSGFIPISGVILTLDNIAPLYFTNTSSTTSASYASNTPMELALPAGNLAQALPSKNIVTVGADGTFNVTIIIDQSWHTGQHIIRASERTFPRSAIITITVHLPGEVPTPSPTSSDTATTSPSATASTTPSGLSCVNPTSLTLGPVSENYSQAVSTQVSLCTSGSGTVNWTASWDQNQAPWLQLDQSTGKIQAPGQQQINVSTLAANLKAGTYTSMVTFSSQQNATPQTLNVTFIVQAGCIRTNQQQYSFTGEASISDPQAQTVTVSNCGNIGTWSTSISTDNNVNWLSIAPTSGALNSGGAQSVTIKASNLNTHLGAGTYTGKILFSIGTNQAIVSVTFKVVSAPKLIVVTPNPPAFNAGKDCTLNQNLKAWICIATIANSSNTLSLSWKSSSTGVPNITFKPASDTLPPAGQERVIITIPQNNCQIPTTLTFTGPANSQNISWSCTSPQ